MEYFHGVLRITNPKTLQKWIDKGWYREQVNQGFVFNPYCGRFTQEPCTCSACRRRRTNKSEIQKILETCEK